MAFPTRWSCNSAGCRAGRCATHLCAPTLEGPVAGWSNNETGFVFGLAGSQHVVVPAGEKAVQFKAQPGNGHGATAIECIGSGGQVLLPLIITEGKLDTVGEQRQMQDIPATWCFSKTARGYTNNEPAIEWCEKIFDATTRPSLPSAWHLLIMDGHKSHTSSEFLAALWRQCIVPFCLPAHSTHIMQPLDVSIFGPLTAAYRRAVADVAQYMPSAGINKAQFGNLYSHASTKVLTSVAANKAFQHSGMTVNPNPDKVLARLPG